MQNIEYKIFTGSDQDIIKRLKTLGAKYAYGIYQKDTYFNYGGGRLKLREVKNKTAELILYTRSDDKRSRFSDYTIVPLAKKNKSMVLNLLKNLFGKKAEVVKKRNLWLLEHTRVHLDEVRGLGKFLELETMMQNINQKTARKEHENIKKILNLSKFKPILSSYCDLIMSNK